MEDEKGLLLVVVVFKELLQFINVAHMHQILLDGCISNQTICTGSWYTPVHFIHKLAKKTERMGGREGREEGEREKRQRERERGRRERETERETDGEETEREETERETERGGGRRGKT